MPLILNETTYINLVDADLYLTSHYLSTDTKLIAWQDLIDADKEALLRKATQIIDRLQFAGRRATTTQLLEFPRILYTNRRINYNKFDYYSDGLSVQTVPPVGVLAAECEIAIDLAQGTDDRSEMQQAGVKSFSLGNLSESYGSIKDITSHEARQLLKRFTLGGARIV